MLDEVPDAVLVRERHVQVQADVLVPDGRPAGAAYDDVRNPVSAAEQ